MPRQTARRKTKKQMPEQILDQTEGQKSESSDKYDPQELEPRWQAAWQAAGLFLAAGTRRPDGSLDPRPKFFLMEMFPYPSGRMHMGHVRNYTIGDVLARAHRMRGNRVLYPMGWDAFGLPAENAAIKAGVHPRLWTEKNIAAMKAPLLRLGQSYDWSHEFCTCDPAYFVHEQRIFIEMWKRGVAYRKGALVNWCPTCATVLANEQVEDGLCWRCQSVVVQRELVQWFIRTTAYAEELLDDLQKLAGKWPEKVLSMQHNWIGRSEGARIRFALEAPLPAVASGEASAPAADSIEVFTTCPDTLFGATFMSIAAEHPLALRLCHGLPEEKRVAEFVAKVRAEDKLKRGAEDYVKEGVFTGAYVINPATSRRMPVYIANFVLMDYGTGAVMAVPAHDQRDFEFAAKYKLPIEVVIAPPERKLNPQEMTAAYPGPGTLVDSGHFNGEDNIVAKGRIVDWLKSRGQGERAISYRLRDWLVSRQRYWGCPIPMVECLQGGHGYQPVPAAELPVVLPEDIEFLPNGQSPLATHPTWSQTKCPICGGPARRETDTMDGFMESSWYFLRYTAPQYKADILDEEGLSWLPVDLYIGGSEHATKHLIYARFFTKMLSDWGVLPKDFREPFTRLLTQGMVLKDAYRCPEHDYLYPEEVQDGHCKKCGRPAEYLRQMKMSKSFRNVVEPMSLVERYGADTVRLFCLFAAPPDSVLDWNEAGVEGCARFLARLFRLIRRAFALPEADATDEASQALRRKTHKTIRRVTHDLFERLQFNTAIAAIMELCNEVSDYLGSAGAARTPALREALESAVLLLSPMAPHICEELWHTVLRKGSALGTADAFVVTTPWPSYSESIAQDEQVTIVVQVNGKKRGDVLVPPDSDEALVKDLAMRDGNVLQHVQGKAIRKVVFVKGRLLNLVVG
jgi:leucyl-tRNA synthetase